MLSANTARQPDVKWFHALQQIAEAIGILNIRRMDEDAEQQPVRVHRDVPLAPLQPLRGIPTTWPPLSVVFTLWVSMIAAVGLGSRPAPSRSMTTKW